MVYGLMSRLAIETGKNTEELRRPLTNRLFVTSLKSIGVVTAGDNPEAEVVIFKSRVDKHALPGSIDARVDLVRRAYDDKFPSPQKGPHRWVSSVFDSFVIVEDGDDTLRLSYSILDDVVTFGSPEQVELETAIVGKVLEADVYKRKFSAEQRKELAESGKALKDGSFPIVNKGDLRNAISSFGRSGAKTAVKAHIIRRAKALGATDVLPDGWNVSKLSVKAESLHDSQKVNMDLSAIEDDQLRKSIEDAFTEKDTEVSDLETNLEKAVAKVVELEKGDPPEDDVPDEVKVLIKDRDDQITKLRTDLDDAVTKARVAEYVVKAEPLQGLLGKPDEVGVVFADLADKAPESFTKLETMLEAAAQREDLAKLFATMGAGEGDPETTDEGKRDAWIEKNKNDDETRVQAAGRYWVEHPDAVKDSRS